MSSDRAGEAYVSTKELRESDGSLVTVCGAMLPFQCPLNEDYAHFCEVWRGSQLRGGRWRVCAQTRGGGAIGRKVPGGLKLSKPREMYLMDDSESAKNLRTMESLARAPV